MELRYENEKLRAIIAEKEKAAATIEQLYKDKLVLELEKNQQTYLIETKTKEEKINELEQENEKLKAEAEELERYKREAEEYKRKEEEYNSKSLFYRLTHKFNA